MKHLIDKYVQDKVRIPLLKYYDKYITEDRATVINNDLKNINSDIQFFKEYIKRNKTTQNYSFQIKLGNTQYDTILMDVGDMIVHYGYETNNQLIYFFIYNILQSIFLEYWEDVNKTFDEYIEFYPVLKYYLDYDLGENVNKLISSSWALEQFNTKLTEYEKTRKQNEIAN